MVDHFFGFLTYQGCHLVTNFQKKMPNFKTMPNFPTKLTNFQNNEKFYNKNGKFSKKMPNFPKMANFPKM